MTRGHFKCKKRISCNLETVIKLEIFYKKINQTGEIYSNPQKDIHLIQLCWTVIAVSVTR